MMTLEIRHQERYSRGELLLRTLFGFIYIVLPHAFFLLFVALASSFLSFLAFWAILFTGRYPRSWFDFQVKYNRWSLRFYASVYNMADGYPAFGMNVQSDHVQFDVAYPERISRLSVLFRALFGWIYVLIPHGIILGLLGIAIGFVNLIAFWVVLFTGRYPKAMFDFQMYYLRWSTRVSLYMGYMTTNYPPFNGEPDEGLEQAAA